MSRGCTSFAAAAWLALGCAGGGDGFRTEGAGDGGESEAEAEAEAESESESEGGCDGVACGDACCAGGEVCFAGACVLPGDACTDFADCEFGDYCEPTLGACLPTDVLPDCEYHPPAGVFSPVVEWALSPESDLGDEPARPDVVAPPVVGDLDADGVPEVAVITYCDDACSSDYGVLRILDGATGAVEVTVTDADHRLAPAAALALGDVDLDGVPEIVGVGRDRMLRAFEPDGSVLWTADEALDWGFEVGAAGGGGVGIADFNPDEADGPEVFFGHEIYDGETGVRLVAVARDSVQPATTAADLDGDGDLELVSERRALHHDGTVLWTRTDITNTDSMGFPAVGDFDGDGAPEVAVVISGDVWLLAGIDGATVWGPEDIPGGGRGGPPVVADFDGDGLPEVGTAGADYYVVFDPDGAAPVLWQSPTQDDSSHVTGSSVFDFDGDGVAEVVYSDECFTRVYAGPTGDVLFETPNSTRTRTEYPLVADVDGDSNAEIVIVANRLVQSCSGDVGLLGTAWEPPSYGSRYRGLIVYGDALDNWVATRRIWSGHAYHITETDGDLGVASPETENFTTWNNFRQNALGPFFAPDLVPTEFEEDADLEPEACAEGTVALRAEVTNQGAIGVPAGLPVSFYVMEGAAWTWFATVATDVPLLPGASTWVEATYTPPVGMEAAEFDFRVVVDDDGTGAGVHNECEDGGEDNNEAFLSDAGCAGPG